jgi:hypothetical protein
MSDNSTFYLDSLSTTSGVLERMPVSLRSLHITLHNEDKLQPVAHRQRAKSI